MSQQPKTTVPTGKRLCSVHRAATLALSKHIQAQNEASLDASAQQDIIRLSVESEENDIITDEGSERFHAVLSVLLMKPKCREFQVQGPWRNTKPEAIKDSEVLGKAFSLEGEVGAKRVSQRLERKRWSSQEIEGADEKSLEGLLVLEGPRTKQEKLIPPGEGWVRATDDMLWDPRSQVYFVQSGDKMGQYLVQDSKTKAWQEVDPPHTSSDHPVSVKAAGASAVRRGAKMERTVVLPELPKIARLALKFPLSFVDTPATAFAVFQGLRSPESADWCAKNFHTRLIPKLATKIHNWETKELQDVLKSVLQELDGELLKSTHAYSGCCAAIALLLGKRLIISGVGQVRAVLLFEDGSTSQLLSCTSDFLSPGVERERVDEACGVVHGDLLHRSVDGLDEAHRILAARHAFEVLQLELGAPSDEKQVRTAYRRLALRVHPDKISEASNVEAFNRAFARIESAKEQVEAMLNEDAESCRELHRVLRVEVHTREGAADFLGVDKSATTDTEQVVEEAEKVAKQQIQKLAKMHSVARDYGQAVAICKEAVETLRRPCTTEALPRQEALLKAGLGTSRALGVRDMRFPLPILKMEPESMAWHVPTDKRCRLALLCGATSTLEDKALSSSTARLRKHPKAAALRWCLDADSSASSAGAMCIGFEARRGIDKKGDDSGPSGPPAKRPKMAGQQAGSIMLRHILIRHQQLRAPDPFARREGTARGPGEAEAAALAVLEKLLADRDPNAFLKHCRQLSDCQSADQPGQLSGNLGWIARGQQETSFEEAAFGLEPKEFSDIVTTSRGIHIMQRMA